MAQVVLEMTGDVAKLLAGLNQVVTKLTGLEKRLGKTGKTGKDAADKIKGGMDKAGAAAKRAGDKAKAGFDPKRMASFVTALGGVATGAGVILASYKLITAEITKMIKLQSDQAKQQIPLSAARQGVIANLAGTPDTTIKKALSATSRIAAETGVDEKFIARAMAAAISSSGQNLPASISAVRAAARKLPHDPSAIEGFAGSLLDLSKVTGTTDAAVNMGLLGQVGALSRVVNPAQQAKNIPRSLINQMSFGASPEAAAALFATISTETADFMGAVSGTASINVAKQLRNFFAGASPEALARVEPGSAEEKKLRSRAKLIQQAGGGKGTLRGRVGALQGSPELARLFFEQASFEAGAQGALESLLKDPQSSAAKSFRENLGKIPGPAGLSKIASESLRQMEIDPLSKVSAVERAARSATEQLLTSDVAGGQAGAIRVGVKAALDASGEGALSAKLQAARFEMASKLGTKDPAGVGATLLRERAAELRHPVDIITGGYEDFSTIPVPISRDPTALETGQAQILERLAETLDKLNVGVDGMNKKLGIDISRAGGGTTHQPHPSSPGAQ